MKTILVPTDFSKQAHWATEVAIGIAKKTKATIILLHVVEYVMEDSLIIEEQVSGSHHQEDKLFTRRLIEERKKQLAEALNEVRSSAVSAKSELRAGNAFHGICAIIAEHKADLVVMGTAGGQNSQDPVGSTTEKVVRYATCPVLSIHEKFMAKEFKDIVYATSLSDNEKSFVAVVKAIQELYNATIHIVRINTPSTFLADHSVKKNMESFAKNNMLKNYTLNLFSDDTEDRGIVYFANQVKADMITLATHGRTGLSHILFSSIAEDVVHNSVKPVLTCVLKKTE